jgi:hypothetical protein
MSPWRQLQATEHTLLCHSTLICSLMLNRLLTSKTHHRVRKVWIQACALCCCDFQATSGLW